MDSDQETKPLSYWESQGWEKTKPNNGVEVYKGKYKVPVNGVEQEFNGFVVVETVPSYSLDNFRTEEKQQARVFIENPPEEIKKHPKGRCLGLVSKPNEEHGSRFSLHFTRPPQDADTAIRFMEEMLRESFEPQQKK